MMLPLPRFDLAMPTTVDEAVDLLATDGARIIAGGTDLLPSMKHRLFDPSLLVSLARLERLKAIEPGADGGLAIGAMASLDQVSRDEAICRDYSALAESCRTVATPTIQKMGTLGGNVMLDTRCLFYNQPAGWRKSIGGCLKAEGDLCHVALKGKGCYAAQSSDTVPVLALLGAQLELRSIRGTRTIALDGAFGEDGRDWLPLARDELLTRILLPPAPAGQIVQRKLRLRQSIDYALLLTAAHLRPDGSGTIVLSALGPAPVRIDFAAGTTHDAIAEQAYVKANPLATHFAASTWRKRMVRVEVRRALDAMSANK
jgi:4-hydroxybenzoyl-CoA reductase subunit beta